MNRFPLLGLFTISLSTLLSTLLCNAAFAAEPVTVHTPWARATVPAAQVGAVYLSLQNPGMEKVRILAASSPACRTTEIHDHVRLDNGNVQMVAVPSLEIAAGATVTLQPGGKHIMLIGLLAPLVEGKTVALTLTTESGQTIAIAAPIKGIGAMSADEAADEASAENAAACACCALPETPAAPASDITSDTTSETNSDIKPAANK